MTRQIGPELQSVPEWRNVDLEAFQRDIFPLHRPAVLKGLVADWPAAQAGMQSPEAMSAYLKRFDRGAPIEVLMAPHTIGGRFFYQEDMKGFNFTRWKTQTSLALEHILAQRAAQEPLAVFVQSAAVAESVPDFSAENSITLAGANAPPRIWIGNAVSVATHYDLAYNIACVVAGRRRFTLFPPEQLENLYVSPLEDTPAGTPISMVRLDEPDLERYPRFEQALATAQSAELEAGDAIYIPFGWWHHVQSLSALNVLVNYWWNDARFWLSAPYASLMHAVLGLRDLPADQRAVWRAMFDYYVFQTGGEPLAHLAPELRGSMAPLTPERAKHMAQMLRQVLGN